MHDDMLVDALEPLLGEQCTPAVVRAIDGGASGAGLWEAIEATGFCDALVPVEHGGAGLGLRDVFAVVEACGRHALPLPLPQSMLARALLACGGVTAPPGAIALAVRAPEADLLQVDGGAVADLVLVADGMALRLFDLKSAARELVGDGSLDARIPLPASELTRLDTEIDLRAQQALLLAAQMSGSMRQVLAVSLQYANERTQFGRSIGKFQAVQQQLSVMAEHVEAAHMAARMAFDTANITAAPLLCALAKATASAAVVPVASIAHAVHGAIGITREYHLQLHTRRLHAARVAAGSESYWHARIGAALLQRPGLGIPEFARTALAPAV